MRNTKQRAIIEEVLKEAGRPVNTTDIFILSSKKHKNIGIATIYRTLKKLLEENKIVTASIPGDTPYYEMAHKHHHHHFKCDKCGTVIDVEDCLLDEKKLKKSLLKSGLRLKNHDITLYGTCNICN